MKYLGALALMLLTAGLWRPAGAQERTVNIGYQKYGTLVFEKARGTLEKRLAPLHVHVTWTEFLGGPALLEAMGAESVDFGTTGDAPPIFAQAAGVPLVYVAAEPATPHGEAVIVPEGSPIRGIADLRGKKIALNKGSNVHNLLVRVLAAGGLTPADVTSVYLKPSDARPAFENGSVDAWAIWDPFLSAAQTAVKTRVICDGVGPDGRVIDENHQFFLATRDFATKNADILRVIIADLRETEAYGAAHRDEVARLLAPEMRMDPAAVRQAVGRLAFGVQPITPAIIASQQDIADTLVGLRLIPVKVDVHEAELKNFLF
jgi:sulfonate transport system substrate-binding protein